MSVLLTEPDFYDLAMAYFKKAASQNVVYAEVFFDPQAHTTRGVEFSTVIEGLHRAQQDAEASLGLRSQLIMCFLRDLPGQSASETLEMSMPYRDWIVGVGLDSDEKDNPPVKFAAVFEAARAAGYRLTMHCDVDQQDSVENIRQCLDVIGVERIDHGVNCLEDSGLVASISERRIGLTVCPISNRHVTDGLKAEAIREMLGRSMLVTINSDDPAYFPGYVNENFLAVHEAVVLTRPEIVQLARNVFTIAWIGDDERADYLGAIEAYAEKVS
jgi:adenosine deaminase